MPHVLRYVGVATVTDPALAATISTQSGKWLLDIRILVRGVVNVRTVSRGASVLRQCVKPVLGSSNCLPSHFNIDNTAAFQAIEDSKALHARRWQTKEGM